MIGHFEVSICLEMHQSRHAVQAIQRAGNWGNHSRNLRYHSKWDIDAVAALGGYEGPTRFLCPRAEVEVPDELVQLLVPRVVLLLEQSHSPSWEGSWLQSQLKVMQQLACVVIQDAAAMPAELSGHCVVKLLASHPKWRYAPGSHFGDEAPNAHLDC